MVSCEYYEMFENTYFEKHLQTGAFGAPEACFWYGGSIKMECC